MARRGRPKGNPMVSASIRVTQAQADWMRRTPGSAQAIREAIDAMIEEAGETFVDPSASD